MKDKDLSLYQEIKHYIHESRHGLMIGFGLTVCLVFGKEILSLVGISQ